MVETGFHQCILKNCQDIVRFYGLRNNSSAMCLENEVVTWEMSFVNTQQDEKLTGNGNASVFSSFALIDE